MYRVSVSILAITIDISMLTSGIDDTQKQSIDIGIGVAHHGIVLSLIFIKKNLHKCKFVETVSTDDRQI